MQLIDIPRRRKVDDPNHHLWNNHGIWWMDCSVRMPDSTRWRLHKNLRTSDVHVARQMRDRILKAGPTCSAVLEA